MKIVGPPERKTINAWVTKPKSVEVLTPMKSAINPQDNPRSIRLDRLAIGAIGYMASRSADVQQQQTTLFLSGPFSDGCGWSITPDNFRKSMAIFAVRKAVKRTWLNEYDQFTTPDHSPGKVC